MYVSATITQEDPEKPPRLMVNQIETLDKAVSEVSNGLVININSPEALPALKQVLNHDRNGKNKIYLVPDSQEWDLRIELPGGFAFADNDFLSRIRSIPGITEIKER